MMKRLLAVIICLAMIAGVAAAWAESDPEVSPEAAKVDAFGIPTVNDIAEMKAEADGLWDEQDYIGAAEAYAELAQQAGWMLEIVTAINQPYYTAENADAVPAEMAERVAKSKAQAEEYLAIKKLATIRAGLSCFNNEDYESALPFLMEALSLIDAADTENWALCAGAILMIIEEVEIPEEEE